MAVKSKKKRRLIKKEAGYRCAVPTCQSTSPLEIHHITPENEDGTDDLENLICLCRNCHGRCHNGEIERQSIESYKIRLRKISTILAPHHYHYLEALYYGERVELSQDDRHLASKLEREGFVSIRKLKRPIRYRLRITRKGREFIE